MSDFAISITNFPDSSTKNCLDYEKITSSCEKFKARAKVNSYTQSINNANNRTGGLFERPFRRINVENDSYLSQLIWYIHFNPQKHGVIRDFRSYHHSSYHSHLSIKPTKLKRDEILAWFGGRKRYIGFHDQQHDESELQKWLIEF